MQPDELAPIYEKPLQKHLGYGTAGFRCHHSRLEGMAAFRISLFIAMRIKNTGAGGIMITASHNQHEDNGVKMIERDGTMLDPKWEDVATMIVNSHDLVQTVKDFN